MNLYGGVLILVVYTLFQKADLSKKLVKLVLYTNFMTKESNSTQGEIESS